MIQTTYIRHYLPLSITWYIDQVDCAKILGVFYSQTLFPAPHLSAVLTCMYVST